MGKGRFAMAIISIAMMVSLIGCSYGSHLVASAKYPESVAYDDYDILREIKENNPVSPAYLKGMEDFSANTAVEILRTQDQTKNTLYSPISLYFALALTASGAKNQTQEEILTLLHMKDSGIKQLERETGNLYRLLYRDNKVGKFHIANSLWMAHEVPFNQAFLDTATKNYYASLFSVDFSDKKTGKLMGKWVSENTNGMLEGEHKTDSDFILSLLNAIYFYDEWEDPFDKRDTKKDTFNCADGQKISGDFMNKSFTGHPFIKGEEYVYSSLSFKNGASIHFYLPNEGENVYDLISSSEKMKKLLACHDARTKKETGTVVFQIPKYDYGSKFLLNNPLMKMGMKTAFDGNADFSGITRAEKARVSEVIQETHITIDEKGCEAAALTKVNFAKGTSVEPVENKVAMNLDRPFLYTITSENGVVLFMGIINNPFDINAT